MRKSDLISPSKITVIKIGGNLLDESRRDKLVRGLQKYVRKNPTIIVHGGGKEITSFCEKLGIKSRFVKGRRYTDKSTMEAVELILCGRINSQLVSRLNQAGVQAIGLSGRTAETLTARPLRSLGLVGEPFKVRTNFVLSLVSLGFVPVFASVAANGHGSALNVNADEMASFLALSLRARRLIYFTDVPGILDSAGRTVSKIDFVTAQRLIRSQVISGGMIPKINSALSALKKGVGEVWILEGKLPLHRARGTFLSYRNVTTAHPFGGVPNE